MTGGRLIGLDGLRGVAAIGVMLVHTHLSILPMGHGYLAVDLFFMLSGYVLAQRYEPALAKGSSSGMGFCRFMALRLERLYPMLFLGSLLGLMVYAFGLSDYRPASRTELALAVASQFLLLDFLSPRGFFIFNVVQWSIVAELGANALHALTARWLRLGALIGVIALSALGLMVTTTTCGTMESICPAVHPASGWSRVFFSFFTGVLLVRLAPRWRPAIPELPFPLLAAVLFALLCMPIVQLNVGAGRGLYDLACVALVFPLVVMLGTKARAGSIAAQLGVLSYPLYAIHIPSVQVARQLYPGEVQVLPILAALILTAWLIGRWIDEPLNAWRRGRRQRMTERPPAPPRPAEGILAG